jgi:hypothetical protein
MDSKKGIAEIETAEWERDEFGCLNMYVHTHNDARVHAFLTLRPRYCDRGHIQLNIEGPLDLDESDSFPRFFFSFKEADEHTRLFLLWRLWTKRVHKHKLELP